MLLDAPTSRRGSTRLDRRVPYALYSGEIAVVVVVKDGSVLLQKGYGYADVAAKALMDPEKTMIRPGSTSKLFTWTAVMQLVQQGKLDLVRNGNDYLDFKIPEPFDKPLSRAPRGQGERSARLPHALSAA